MDVKTKATAIPRQPRLLARLIGLGAILLVILACGTSSYIAPVPLATLEPNVAPFRVVSLDQDNLQARNGRDGTLLWQTPVPSGGPSILTFDATANAVYISNRDTLKLVAVSADDGHILWKFSQCTGLDEQILLGAGRVYLTCGQTTDAGVDDPTLATLYALDAATGAVRWQATEYHARALVGANVIAQTPGGLAALDGATGKLLWQHTVTIAPETGYPSNGQSTIDQFTFVIHASPTGTLYYSPDGEHAEALRSSDGTLVWRSLPVQDITSAPNETYTQHASVVLATANEVVTQGLYGVAVLRASDGAVLWRHYQYPESGGVNTLVGDDGTVYVSPYEETTSATSTPTTSDDQFIAALDPTTGSLRWKAVVPDARYSSLQLVGDILLVGTSGAAAYRTSDGTRLWNDPQITLQYSVREGQVLCVVTYSTIYLLKIADGLRVWDQSMITRIRAVPLLIAG